MQKYALKFLSRNKHANMREKSSKYATIVNCSVKIKNNVLFVGWIAEHNLRSVSTLTRIESGIIASLHNENSQSIGGDWAKQNTKISRKIDSKH